jgi:hypothetical protein
MVLDASPKVTDSSSILADVHIKSQLKRHRFLGDIPQREGK